MEVQKQIEEMDEFLLTNLVEACKEMTEFNSTGLLRNGCVRFAASMLTHSVFFGRQLLMAQDAVKRLAVNQIAQS